MSDDVEFQRDGWTGRTVYRTTVRPEWIDYNGHMNVAYYGLVFDQAADAALDALGLGEAYRQASGCSIFVRESHLVFDQEVGVGVDLVVFNRVLGADDRRLVLFQEMHEADRDGTVATCEVLCVHVDLLTRRSRPWPAVAGAALSRLVNAPSSAAVPARAGRAIALSRPRSGKPV